MTTITGTTSLPRKKKKLLPRRCFAGCFSFIVFKASRGVEMNNSQSAAVETTSPKANPLRPISNQRCATNTTPFAWLLTCLLAQFSYYTGMYVAYVVCAISSYSYPGPAVLNVFLFAVHMTGSQLHEREQVLRAYSVLRCERCFPRRHFVSNPSRKQNNSNRKKVCHMIF